MAVKINLGNWNSVFAVPSKVVDEGLKFASAYQLKVLLYILRNSDKQHDYSTIAKELSMHEDDVKDSVKFWIDRDLFMNFEQELSPSNNETLYKKAEESIPKKIDKTEKAEDIKPEKIPIEIKKEEPTIEVKEKNQITRPQKPDSFFVAEQLRENPHLALMIEETEAILNKPLTPGDVSTLVMLNYTCGLPPEVIIMLVHYCISIEKSNMRNIERIGISWSDESIFTLELAEQKIENTKAAYSSWGKVSKIFGLKNVGSPTKKQLELSSKWIMQYKIHDDLIREAYERCVDTKGEFNLKYIDGIINNWNTNSIFTIKDLNSFESNFSANNTNKISKNKPNNKPSAKPKQKVQSQEASFDINALMQKSIFDD